MCGPKPTFTTYLYPSCPAAFGVEAAEGDFTLLAELAIAEEDPKARLCGQAGVDDDVEGAKVPAA